MSYELIREDWKKFFDTLSKRRFEWKTEIEVLSPQLGDQTLNMSLPFNGITVEELEGTTKIVILVGETSESHQTHSILDPVRVAFLASENDRGDVVAIEEADGTKTLIRFVEPIDLLVGFTSIEMISTAA